jgi:hypothetical protein
MGDVVHLADQRAPAPEEPLLYYCERCDSREFTLYASGVTYCSSCGALMRNLLVIRTP